MIYTLDIEKLLSKPIINYRQVDIKFKRTSRAVDKKSFLLCTNINDEHDKIDSSRLKLYINTLVKGRPINIFDQSRANEQVIFIECQNDLGICCYY